jgi:hypothetical protein
MITPLVSDVGGPASRVATDSPRGVPPTLLADPALCATAKLIAIALVTHWAWTKDHCWPSDKTIAAKIGRSPGHVQRCLRQLERAGWIAREQTNEVPGGRRIWLLWRRGAGARPVSAPAREGGPAPARSERSRIVTPGIEREERQGPGQRGRGPIAEAGEVTRPKAVAMPSAPVADEPSDADPARTPASGPTAGARSTASSLKASDWASGTDPGPPPEPARDPAPQGAHPGADPPGAAMARLFDRVGVGRPQALAGDVPSPPPTSPATATATSPSATAGAVPAARAGLRPPALTTEALEALAAGGDPIFLGELARRRAAEEQRAAVAALPPPATTAELLARIREKPSYVAQATEALVQDLDDRRSWRGLHAICRRAFEGELEPAALVHALGKAKGPKARKPGAIFTLEVSRWRGP